MSRWAQCPEGCESGRIGTPGERVWGNPPWVRIPLPPLALVSLARRVPEGLHPPREPPAGGVRPQGRPLSGLRRVRHPARVSEATIDLGSHDLAGTRVRRRAKCSLFSRMLPGMAADPSGSGRTTHRGSFGASSISLRTKFRRPERRVCPRSDRRTIRRQLVGVSGRSGSDGGSCSRQATGAMTAIP